MPKHKKGSKSAGNSNKTKNSLVKVVIKTDDKGEWIKPKTLDKFFINDDAEFPVIEFEIKTEISGPYKWNWTIAWDAKVSGLREHARGKKLESFSEKGTFASNEKCWNAKNINKVVGGTLTVTVEVGEEHFKRTVLVLATPPSAEKIKAYLTEKKASALEKLLAQESKFKHIIVLDKEPVVAGDRGYGVAQLTKPKPSYSQIWSWKQNIDAAIILVAAKMKIAKKHLGSHGSYTQEMLDTETISLWNGGTYYEWQKSPEPGSWVRNTKILCDSKTGNMGWDMTEAGNKGKTEEELHERDKGEYGKMKKGQTAEHPWEYTGVCYADHVLGN